MRNSHIFFSTCLTIFVAFLGKRTGEERPNGLFTSTFRLWTAIHRKEVATWDVEKAGVRDTVVVGSFALCVALWRQVREEIDQAGGMVTCTILWDTAKCYASFSLRLCWKFALKLDFGIFVLPCRVPFEINSLRSTHWNQFTKGKKKEDHHVSQKLVRKRCSRF